MKAHLSRKLLLLVLSSNFVGAVAQNQGNIWYFGIQAGLDFNGSEPSALLDGQTYAPSPNLWNEGTSTISNTAGNLLLYSNGAKIWNRDHQVMQGGDSLMGHPSSTHGALIVPRPLSDRFFYVFTTDCSENGFMNGWRYSVVDMCAAEGKGAVMTDEKNILLAGPVAEKLAAVRHANGVDYWVLSHQMGNNVFLVALLTASGLGPVVETAIGPIDGVGWGGQVVFSVDEAMLGYVVAGLQGSMSLFDFNTTTGEISNARTRANSYNNMVWGLAFSPNGSKLYTTTSNTGALRQYDLNAATWQAILASEVTLGTIVPDYWKDLRLGPDNRIYVTHAQSPFLGRIATPDVPGVGCGFTDNVVSLGGRLCSFGLPNFVTGYSYDNDEPLCPEIPIGVEDLHQKPTVVLSRTNGLTVAQTKDYDAIEVFDVNGRLLAKATLRKESPTVIEMASAPSGLLFFRLIGGVGMMTGRLLVVP